MSSDLAGYIVPSEFSPYVLEQSVVKNGLLASGIIANDPMLSGMLAQGGQVANVLTFKNLDANGTAANATSSDQSSSATPELITAHNQKFTRVGRNKVWAAADWDYSILGQDPAQYIAQSVATAMIQWRQTSLINELNGVTLALIAGSSASVNKVAVETLGTPYLAAQQINASSIGATIVGAWGDAGVRDSLMNGMNGVAIFMHSNTYNFLLSTDYVSFQRISTQTFGFTTYLGYPVIVDDTLPVRVGTTSGHVYTTFLVKQGGIRFGYSQPKNATEIFRAPLVGNGGGADQLFQRDSFAYHVTGMSFTGSAAGDTPTDAELATANKWTQVLSAKQTGVAVLIHNNAV
jgi:hypothetical protein